MVKKLQDLQELLQSKEEELAQQAKDHIHEIALKYKQNDHQLFLKDEEYKKLQSRFEEHMRVNKEAEKLLSH